jgi:photosystem II stability/assembly factor-like uncharacterized protein
LTWSRTSYAGAGGDWPDAIVISPDDPRTVYVGTYSRGYEEDAVVLRTQDGGGSWTPLNTGLPEQSVTISMALDPTNAQTIYAGTTSTESTLGGPGIFKTTNGGRKWHAVSSGLPKSHGFYPDVYDLAFDRATPNVLYAATDRGTWKTTDGGKSWRKASRGLITTLVTDPRTPTLLLAGSAHGGVLRSTTSGRSWRSVNAGLTAMAVNAIAVDPSKSSTIYLGTSESGLVKTVDGGRSWSALRSLGSQMVRSIVVNPRAPRTIHVAAWGRGVLTSHDAGKSWHRGRGLPNTDYIFALAIDPQSPGTVYAADDGSGRPWRTLNGGGSWHAISDTKLEGLTEIAVDPVRTATIYAGSRDGRISISSDAGQAWRRIPAGLAHSWNTQLTALVVTKPRGDVFVALNADFGEFGVGVYRLERGAKRWTRVVGGLPRLPNGKIASLRSLAAHPRTGEVYVGTDLGCYELMRAEGRLRWQLVDPIFRGRLVRRIAYAPSGSRMYAATAGGLLVSRKPGR